LSQRGRIGRLALGQKLFNFNALRRSIGASESGAFQRRGGGGKSQRLPKLLASVIASVKAPWNTSPAPSVSTVCTGKAGVRCR
jgi:hypothetical protein